MMWRRLSGAALVVTAAVLPFELRATLPAGPLRLSSVELFVYLTLALWGASRLATARWSWRDASALVDPRRWPRALAAAAGLALVLMLSAACAARFRGPAFKFALRSCGGILLGVAAADLLRAPATLRRTLVALVGGTVVAAVAAVAEARLAFVGPLLLPFHEQTFQALGQVRGSGPFQFPNIAAMALEAAVPVALALGATAAGAPRSMSAGIVAATVLLAGVISSGSRAGLVTGALAVVAMTARLRKVASRRTDRIVAAGCLLLLVGFFAADGPLSTRLRFWNEGHWYRARIAPAGAPGSRLPAYLPPDSVSRELLAVQNQGALAWNHLPPSPIRLSHHWLDAETGAVLVRDGVRTALPADVPPGASLTLRATVRAPARPGRYVLWWDMVQEDVTWFGAHGDPGWRQPILVSAEPPAAAPPPPVADLASPLADAVAPLPSRTWLWRAALAAFRDSPLLGVGPDNYRRLYGRYLPAAAGNNKDDRLHANSLYFETLADLGLVGLAAGVVLIVALAGTARRAIAATGLLGVGVTVALGTFLLHGTLDYFFEFTPTYSMFWLLVGALVALDPPASEITA